MRSCLLLLLALSAGACGPTAYVSETPAAFSERPPEFPLEAGTFAPVRVAADLFQGPVEPAESFVVTRGDLNLLWVGDGQVLVRDRSDETYRLMTARPQAKGDEAQMLRSFRAVGTPVQEVDGSLVAVFDEAPARVDLASGESHALSLRTPSPPQRIWLTPGDEMNPRDLLVALTEDGSRYYGIVPRTGSPGARVDWRYPQRGQLVVGYVPTWLPAANAFVGVPTEVGERLNRWRSTLRPGPTDAPVCLGTADARPGRHCEPQVGRILTRGWKIHLDEGTVALRRVGMPRNDVPFEFRAPCDDAELIRASYEPPRAIIGCASAATLYVWSPERAFSFPSNIGTPLVRYRSSEALGWHELFEWSEEPQHRWLDLVAHRGMETPPLLHAFRKDRQVLGTIDKDGTQSLALIDLANGTGAILAEYPDCPGKVWPRGIWDTGVAMRCEEPSADYSSEIRFSEWLSFAERRRYRTTGDIIGPATPHGLLVRDLTELPGEGRVAFAEVRYAWLQ